MQKCAGSTGSYSGRIAFQSCTKLICMLYKTYVQFEGSRTTPSHHLKAEKRKIVGFWARTTKNIAAQRDTMHGNTIPATYSMYSYAGTYV